MVKVLDPDGVIIGVYESKDDVPRKIWNRFHTYAYPKSACDIIEVTDPKDIQRLTPSLKRKPKGE